MKLEPEDEAAATRVEPTVVDRTEGPAVAALLGAGIGALLLGLLTTLAAASETVAERLELNADVGPLSGKTTFAVIGWLVAWAVLHVLLRHRGRLTNGVMWATAALLFLGLLGTFPIFFAAFASE